MGASYYQFCPVAKAMELLDERWTLLIVRELLSGSVHFNEIRRGVPRMSPTLLSKRLSQLIRAGVLMRSDDDQGVRYVLTPAGQELRPVAEALAVWGIRWIGELGDKDLDPKLLLWDMCRSIDRDTIPRGRTVVHFTFSDVSASVRDWWVVASSHSRTADLCDSDPGYPVAVTVSATLRAMTGIWRGDVRWADTLRSGDVALQGPSESRRAVSGWFTLPPFASVPRPG
ncbi:MULTISPECIES: helix-turn-helix domain-containing protein [unclassified Streptomyces]|uniref:winged helix-turn-helix transcriptional regulator n=1 Tax=unclassified Streptomyces TaxID=2593676 RepID=UPI002DD8A871|nr:helix-turn-helix domain-containing protein [Streptomyces sp. NBC_01750]WSA97967.1 helix-turn-helix transcriptional regulator [Streptomyces sp. NBC_01794]WSD37480.1 helix-turn-helix transcriptional regulator [Streptomyces sp. NBC_01750]